jgi:hypothetical protein
MKKFDFGVQFLKCARSTARSLGKHYFTANSGTRTGAVFVALILTYRVLEEVKIRNQICIHSPQRQQV